MLPDEQLMAEASSKEPQLWRARRPRLYLRLLVLKHIRNWSSSIELEDGPLAPKSIGDAVLGKQRPAIRRGEISVSACPYAFCFRTGWAA